MSLPPRAHQGDAAAEHRGGEPVPLDRRIAEDVDGIEQLAVLDERERLRHQRRHRLEVLVDATGVADFVEPVALRVDDLEAGLRLLAIDRRHAETHQPVVERRQPRLRHHAPAVLVQSLELTGQARVPESLVVGPRLLQLDRGRGSGAELGVELGSEAREQPGLAAEGPRLEHRRGDQREDEGRQQEPATDAPCVETPGGPRRRPAALRRPSRKRRRRAGRSSG